MIWTEKVKKYWRYPKYFAKLSPPTMIVIHDILLAEHCSEISQKIYFHLLEYNKKSASMLANSKENRQHLWRFIIIFRNMSIFLWNFIFTKSCKNIISYDIESNESYARWVCENTK